MDIFDKMAQYIVNKVKRDNTKVVNKKEVVEAFSFEIAQHLEGEIYESIANRTDVGGLLAKSDGYEVRLGEFGEGEEFRICSECGEKMTEGFCIENGEDYYCAEECLKKNMTWEQYLALYDGGEGDTYWTQWE